MGFRILLRWNLVIESAPRLSSTSALSILHQENSMFSVYVYYNIATHFYHVDLTTWPSPTYSHSIANRVYFL